MSQTENDPVVHTVALSNGRRSRAKPVTLKITLHPLSPEQVEALAQIIVADIRASQFPADPQLSGEGTEDENGRTFDSGR